MALSWTPSTAIILLLLQPSHPFLVLLIYNALLLASLTPRPRPPGHVPLHAHPLLSSVARIHQQALALRSSFGACRAAAPRSLCALLFLALLAIHRHPSFVLALLLVWPSPPLVRLRKLIAHLLAPTKRGKNGVSTQAGWPSNGPSGAEKCEAAQVSMIIRIELTIVEHQRWGEGQGWAGELTSADKARVGGRWTDGAGAEVGGPDRFPLPSGSMFGAPGGQVGVSWAWAEPQWLVVRPRHPSRMSSHRSPPDEPWAVDHDGWTYADHSWSGFSSRPSFSSFVRKRRWSRPVHCIFSSPASAPLG